MAEDDGRTIAVGVLEVDVLTVHVGVRHTRTITRFATRHPGAPLIYAGTPRGPARPSMAAALAPAELGLASTLLKERLHTGGGILGAEDFDEGVEFEVETVAQ